MSKILIKVSEGKYALSARRGVLAVGGILVVYERSTTETQSARRTHREKKKRKFKVGLTCMLFFIWI